MSNHEHTKYIASLKNIILSKLVNLDIIKYGTFILKNGTTSDIYMDFRLLVNYPQLYSYISHLLDIMYPELLENNTTKLIPIPMGGLPLGYHLTFKKKIPLLMLRDKPKEHGTKKMIEGIITPTDNYFIIEDVITSGTSVLEALKNITSYYIPHTKKNNQTTQCNQTNQSNDWDTINDNSSSNNELLFNFNYMGIVCICNRGDKTHLEGIPIYSLFTLKEIKEYLQIYLDNTSCGIINYFKNTTLFSNTLYSIALQKKSNIILSCDFMSNRKILDLVKCIGHHIVAVKLHLDILDSSTYNYFLKELNILKQEMNFLVIEDAKYADIESIMIEKVNHSQLDIKNIADAIIIHAISGLSVLEGNKLCIPGIVITEMSSSNNLITMDYTTNVITQLRTCLNNNCNSIGGLVCNKTIPNVITPFEMLTMSPGVNLEVENDGYNQCYTIPNSTTNRMGLFWIVGRGITKYKNHLQNNREKCIEVINKYQELGWNYFITY